MPPKYVTTVRQLIFWEYANPIARAAEDVGAVVAGGL